MVGRPRPVRDKKSTRHCVPFLKNFNSKKEGAI
jgi:hypothetical protein